MLRQFADLANKKFGVKHGSTLEASDHLERDHGQAFRKMLLTAYREFFHPFDDLDHVFDRRTGNDAVA